MSTLYCCTKCTWSGSKPSMSDASTLQNVYVTDADGGGWEPRIVRTHVPVCPQCFTAVRSDSFPHQTSRAVA